MTGMAIITNVGNREWAAALPMGRSGDALHLEQGYGLIEIRTPREVLHEGQEEDV